MSYNFLPVLFVLIVLLIGCYPRRRPFVDPVIPEEASTVQPATQWKWRDSTLHTRQPERTERNETVVPAAKNTARTRDDPSFAGSRSDRDA